MPDNTHQTNLKNFPTNGILNTSTYHLSTLKQTLLKKLWNVQSHCSLVVKKTILTCTMVYLCWEISPRDGHLKSSAERLFSRKTNIPLPTTSALKPRVICGVPNLLYKNRMQKKKYHDKTAQLLSVLQPDKTVRLQTDKDFDRKGIVTGIAKTPRSYIVRSGDK